MRLPPAFALLGSSIEPRLPHPSVQYDHDALSRLLADRRALQDLRPENRAYRGALPLVKYAFIFAVVSGLTGGSGHVVLVLVIPGFHHFVTLLAVMAGGV